MRLRDLHSNDNVADGIYLLDGPEDDPMSIVYHGPIPDTDAGRLQARVMIEQTAQRTGRPAASVLVKALPRA